MNSQPDSLLKNNNMNEVINIGLGIEATVLATLIFTIRAIVLLYAIITTIITLRNLAQLAGLEAAGRTWTWNQSATLVPAFAWFVYWLLTQIPV